MYDGQARARSAPRSCVPAETSASTLRISSVAAIAKTPSANVSSLAVLTCRASLGARVPGLCRRDAQRARVAGAQGPEMAAVLRGVTFPLAAQVRMKARRLLDRQELDPREDHAARRQVDQQAVRGLAAGHGIQAELHPSDG